MLFGSLFYYYWTATLVSYLTTQKTILPFEGIPSLLSNTDFQIAINSGTSHQVLFEFSNDPTRIEAWDYRIKHNLDFVKPYFVNGKYSILMWSILFSAWYSLGSDRQFFFELMCLEKHL